MITLSNMSDNELRCLKRAIMNETKKRGLKDKDKDSVDVYSKIKDTGLEQQLEKEGAEDAFENIDKVTDSIYLLCDMAYGNYEIKPRKNKFGESIKKLRRISYFKNLDISEDYSTMADEIIAIFNKNLSKRL